MKKLSTLIVALGCTTIAMAQTPALPNGGFENWGNAAPGNGDEPTGYYSNKSGSNIAQLGPQTAFKDNTVFHGGAAAVRIESKLAPVVNTVVNGNLTTGVVNAPSTSKADGYIGTINNGAPTDIRRMSFNGRPDSLIGWYQYTQGGAAERGKIKAVVHTGQYYDPEAATTYHPDASADRVGSAEFLTPTSNVATWTRFSIPFSYAKSSTPDYIMINITSSNDQLTTVAGSKLWLDDLAVVYNSASNVGNVGSNEQQIKVYASNKTVFIDFLMRTYGKATVQIFDMTGKLVTSTEASMYKLNSIQLGDRNTGIFFYKISGNTLQQSGRLLIN